MTAQYFLLLFSLYYACCTGLQVTILHELDEVALSQTIPLSFILEAHERGVYYDSLRFSMDVPGIEFIDWTVSSDPVIEHSSVLKGHRKIFLENFSVILKYELHNSDEKINMTSLLASAHVYVACLVMNRSGGSDVFNTVLSLGQDREILEPLIAQISEGVSSGRAAPEVLDESAHAKPVENDSACADDLQEIKMLEHIYYVKQGFVSKIDLFWGSPTFYNLYYLLLLIYFFLMLARILPLTSSFLRQNYVFFRELQKAVFFLLIALSLFMVRTILPNYILFFAAAILLLVTGLRYLFFAAAIEGFFRLIAYGIGFMMVCLSLPFFFKGLLVLKYLIVS